MNLYIASVDVTSRDVSTICLNREGISRCRKLTGGWLTHIRDIDSESRRNSVMLGIPEDSRMRATYADAQCRHVKALDADVCRFINDVAGTFQALVGTLSADAKSGAGNLAPARHVTGRGGGRDPRFSRSTGRLVVVLCRVPIGIGEGGDAIPTGQRWPGIAKQRLPILVRSSRTTTVE